MLGTHDLALFIVTALVLMSAARSLRRRSALKAVQADAGRHGAAALSPHRGNARRAKGAT
jgi:hypothetical protein